MNIESHGFGRYRVQSRTDINTWYTVKYWDDQKKWTCDCPWGNMGALRTGKNCAHVEAVLQKGSK